MPNDLDHAVQNSRDRRYSELEYDILEKLSEVTSNLAVLSQDMKYMGETMKTVSGHSDRLTKLETRVELQDKAQNVKIAIAAVIATVSGILIPIVAAHLK